MDVQGARFAGRGAGGTEETPAGVAGEDAPSPAWKGRIREGGRVKVARKRSPHYQGGKERKKKKIEEMQIQGEKCYFRSHQVRDHISLKVDVIFTELFKRKLSVSHFQSIFMEGEG